MEITAVHLKDELSLLIKNGLSKMNYPKWLKMFNYARVRSVSIPTQSEETPVWAATVQLN